MAIWIMAIFAGMNIQIINSIVECNVGHYQIQEKNFGSSGDPTTPLADSPEFLQKLSLIPGVKAVSRELVLEGFVNSTEGAQAVNLLGVHPEDVNKFVPLHKSLTEGKPLDDNSEGALVGQALKEKFHLTLGDQLIFNYQDVSGNLRSELVVIQGFYNANAPSFQRGTIYVSPKVVGRLAGASPEQPLKGIHRYVIFAPTLHDKKQLQSILPENTLLKEWNDINPEMGAVVQFHDGLVNFFLVIVGICISVTILTPISMLWQERVKEFEMLHIIGVVRKRIWMVGLSEAFIMSIFSLAFAFIMITLCIGWQTKTGLDFSILFDQTAPVERAGIVLPRIIYPLLDLKQFLVTISFVLFTVYISYTLAIRNAVKQISYT